MDQPHTFREALSVANSSIKPLRVLFVDDERPLQEFMRLELPMLGHEVTVCPDGPSAVRVLEKQSFDVAILDLRMPGMTGIEVLQHLKTVAPDTEAVVMTGHASHETAVAAMKLGAMDYITKPCTLAAIEAILMRVSERRDLKRKNEALQTRVQAAEGPSLLIGDSPPMQAVRRTIAMVAPTDSTVLITGETGTGKELVARTIYLQSRRADMPFMPVNCAAFTENLVESELFGHKKGAFTSADRDKKGLFEVCDGGTLFLDELGELNKNIQSKLLRFLESGEIRRVGDTQALRVDVRVVCATNRDLRKMIEADEFREDLLFRINTFEIRLPSLRERRSDIPALARHLLARTAKRPVEQVADLLPPATLEVMMNYDWPGNVRELANAMEYSFIVSGGQPISPEHLPATVLQPRVQVAVGGGPATTATPAPRLDPAQSLASPRTLKAVEMEHILRIYEKNNRDKKATAAELGVSLKTLYNKLNQYEEERRSLLGET